MNQREMNWVSREGLLHFQMKNPFCSPWQEELDVTGETERLKVEKLNDMEVVLKVNQIIADGKEGCDSHHVNVQLHFTNGRIYALPLSCLKFRVQSR